ncbi:hypothetical protein Tco_0716214 [Tanacetum coccineum]
MNVQDDDRLSNLPNDLIIITLTIIISSSQSIIKDELAGFVWDDSDGSGAGNRKNTRSRNGGGDNGNMVGEIESSEENEGLVKVWISIIEVWLQWSILLHCLWSHLRRSYASGVANKD